MTSRPFSRARKFLTLLGLPLAFTLVANTALAGNGLPPIPVPGPLPIIGGGGGGGGNGVGGGGPGGGGPGRIGLGGGSSAGSNLQLAGSSFGDFRTIDAGPNDKFGDPLSTDLLGSDRVHARLRYYGESGGVGTTQAVGINLTFAQ